MNSPLIIESSDKTFKDFLFKNNMNRRILTISAIVLLIQFAIFKYFYPFASYIHGDSFSYINAADKNLTINTYLIGYSKFLRLFSVFAKPDLVLVAFQYLFIHFSILYLLFTTFYFYKVGKITQYILLCFMVLNPLFLHLGNMISSDAFFLALTVTWFTLLIWIIHKPSKKIMIWISIVLFIAFTVRYNAMIYPFITAIAYALSGLSMRKKIVGFGLGLLLCGGFVGITMHQYKKLTGFWQYSPFSGWQMANNAMYSYRYVDSANRKPVPEKFAALDNMIRAYFDSTRDIHRFPLEYIQASTFYMWSPGLPLYKYRDDIAFKKDTVSSELKKWATMGPLYKSYGIYIIRNYPLHFLRYFAWPNSNKYYAPPVEFLQNYNSGADFVTEETKKLFGYKSTKVKSRFKSPEVWILNYYPILSGILNVVMLCCLVCFVILKGWKINKIFSLSVILGGSFWLLNAGFTIFASSAALRFQSFPIMLTTVYVTLLIDWMAHQMAVIKNEQTSPKSELAQEIAVNI